MQCCNCGAPIVMVEWRKKKRDYRCSQCKENPTTHAARSSIWRRENKERYAAAARERYKKDPTKAAARARVALEIRRGKMAKKPCEVCGHEKAQAHHSDYTKPLEISWLCAEHHRAWHKEAATKVA